MFSVFRFIYCTYFLHCILCKYINKGNKISSIICLSTNYFFFHSILFLQVLLFGSWTFWWHIIGSTCVCWWCILSCLIENKFILIILTIQTSNWKGLSMKSCLKILEKHHVPLRSTCGFLTAPYYLPIL